MKKLLISLAKIFLVPLGVTTAASAADAALFRKNLLHWGRLSL